MFSGALTENFIDVLPNLTKLTLAQNNFTSVEPGALMGLNSLRVLDLSQNKIDVIGDRSFSNLGKLNTLRLDTNRIVTLPSRGFSGLKALTSLDLSHNFLQSLPNGSLVMLSNLRELFLRDNDIINLEGKLFDGLSALKRLDLSENPLHCDCRLLSLASFLTASKARLSGDDLAQVTCMTPSHLENAPLALLTPDQLTCEESVQYDDMEPRPGDASDQIRLEAAELAADGGGARLHWRVDPALSPYRCDQVFVFEPRDDHEQHVASVAAECGGALTDPTRLQMDVRWPELRAGQPYRFCLVLVELWGGRPGVGFVRTASQPRSSSEESIHKEQEETDSQV
ncbi:peroxidasin homolog [Pollicipes pollicipes]|uniref:peroxidasin homolog n=1 Tax=Pollicipes pollicipes TaxID=41117 RepID=UPI0018850E00|nr:peroxidasin homolog [Pollicipes pollicipes]